MPFISNSNYNESIIRLSKSIIEKQDFNEALANLSKFSLKGILSNKEIEHLYRQKIALKIVKRWVSDGVKLNPSVISRQLARSERRFTPKYVLEVNTPRYHSNTSCSYLKQDFHNFETPPEITVKGEEMVRKFQEFCALEWDSYKNKSIDVFWEHVGSHFKMKINPKEVAFEFSGASPELKDMTEDAILERIESQKKDIVKYAEKNNVTNLLQEEPYKCSMMFIKDPNDEQENFNRIILDLLRMKKFIRLMVFNFHKKEVGIENGLLSEELLSALGFLPCKACYHRNTNSI